MDIETVEDLKKCWLNTTKMIAEWDTFKVVWEIFDVYVGNSAVGEK